MGPFPHDAPRPLISDQNPAGTVWVFIVEFAHRDAGRSRQAVSPEWPLFPVASNKSKDITI